MSSTEHEAPTVAVEPVVGLDEAMKQMASKLYMMSECRERVTTRSLSTVANFFMQAADEFVRLNRIEKAARTYYTRYAQDEASDVEDCVCGREQHEDAAELRDALLRPNAEIEPTQGRKENSDG